MATSSVIEVRDLAFSYPGQGEAVFEGFSWQVEPGESWAVVGPSGSGKSTLLYLVAGLRRPDSGRILVNGRDPTPRKGRSEVGLVLQDYGLLPWATVWENAGLGLRVRGLHGRGNGVSTDRLGEWLHRLGIAHLRDRYPGQLSGGERQRVAIARALVMDPAVLLLDEPFSALDYPTREGMERLVLDLQRETGTTLVFVTHSIEEAVCVGERVLVLRRPPNREAVVFDNAAGGSRLDRDGGPFVEQCARLRAALGPELVV